MDKDGNNMLDLCRANDTTITLFDSVWPEEYIFSTSNYKMADENNERDIQDLFNGS